MRRWNLRDVGLFLCECQCLTRVWLLLNCWVLQFSSLFFLLALVWAGSWPDWVLSFLLPLCREPFSDCACKWERGDVCAVVLLHFSCLFWLVWSKSFQGSLSDTRVLKRSSGIFKDVKVQTPLARLKHCCATAEPFQGQLGAQIATTGWLDNTGERWERRGRVRLFPRGGSSLSHIQNLTMFFIFIGHNKLIKIPTTEHCSQTCRITGVQDLHENLVRR